MSPEIQARVIDRLIATGKSDEPWALIVLAAMEGADQLDAFLDKKASIAPPERGDATAAVVTEPPGAYVSSHLRRRLPRSRAHRHTDTASRTRTHARRRAQRLRQIELC